jgi:hypothetical protein
MDPADLSARLVDDPVPLVELGPASEEVAEVDFHRRPVVGMDDP